MFNFYLRQTVPFNFSDFFYLPFLFFKKKFKPVNFTENNIRQKIGTKYSIVTDSLRTGLTKSLQFFSNKYPQKNEVILPTYSFYSNLNSILNLNLKVVYAPINNKTLELDLNELPKYINHKTLAIVITHIHGLSYQMDKLVSIIKGKKIILFEDCAHVFGEKFKDKCLGSFGVGCFSFGSGKNITSFGGGSICTNNSNLYKYLKKHQIETVNILKEIKSLLLTIVYTIISNPFFSFLIIKPILGISYLLNLDKGKNKKHIINNNIIENNIYTPDRFQLRLLNYQLKIIDKRIDNIYQKRKRIANIYRDFLNNNKNSKKYNFNFQYPIHTSNKRRLIIKAWYHNVDIQPDYCSFLPKLYKDNKLYLKFNDNIVYLPINYYMSVQGINKILSKII